MNLKFANMNRIRRRIIRFKALFAVLVVFLVELALPTPVVQAAQAIQPLQTSAGALLTQEVKLPQKAIVVLDADAAEARKAKLGEIEKQPIRTLWMGVSAYNSEPGQTDGSPYITASGTFTRPGVVASNYFPIGTRIRMPEYFGDREFRVEDRMNARYNLVVDIWMEDKTEAKQWGRRNVKIEVLSYR